ncbi:hypothetical protein LGK95_16335 [Clostridium algoriphilum]|uniref:hypothetical protein n=1 Tax=Clostridium algoriphilum TaxID=198347 RepID=UPI001CF59DD0|nr:hypothetical protein [Clostridium algoriphilum]MCB2295053.1 hypothetical protein [Clostridium algoriphilum]
MSTPLTLFLIGSILSLDLLILITMKYIILMTNWIKDLQGNSKQEDETILQFHTPKPDVVVVKSKIKGSNVLYFDSYSKVK